MATLKVQGIGPDDPLWHWVPGPRAVSDAAPSDNVWIRLVDLPSALAARGYDGACDVVVSVTDELLPANAGSWRIRVADGEAEATRSTADPELALDVSALGAAWLGAANLVAMHRAGLVTEHRPDAVRELWRALRADVSPTPTCGF
ncbi:MAG: sterol carrier protein domain-containing protein [Nocardioides sp.]